MDEHAKNNGIDRRGFFRSLTQPFEKAHKEQKDHLHPLPPYCTSAEKALIKCVKCEKPCVTECPEKIIFAGNGDVPRLNFTNALCTFCEKCAKICPFDVLSLKNSHVIGAEIVLNEETCLSWQGVICSVCKEVCSFNAIHFEGLNNPRIDISACTRCGGCQKPCPIDAINIFTFR